MKIHPYGLLTAALLTAIPAMASETAPITQVPMHLPECKTGWKDAATVRVLTIPRQVTVKSEPRYAFLILDDDGTALARIEGGGERTFDCFDEDSAGEARQ